MKKRSLTPLRLNRETVRDLAPADLQTAAGGQPNLTLPPTLCACTGTETQGFPCGTNISGAIC